MRDEPDEQTHVAKMVVVSVDVASKAELVNYVHGLRAHQLLARIFVDETIVMDVEYHKELEALKVLRGHDCPVVLLTTMLPPQLERWFRQAVLAMDESMIRTMEGDQKGVVYCPSKTACERLTEKP